MPHKVKQPMTVGDLDVTGALRTLHGDEDPTAPTGIALTSTDVAIRRAALTLDDVAVAITDANTDGGYGAVKLCDLPAGHVQIFGAVADLTFVGNGSTIGATAALDAAIGTAAEAADATLNGTSANIVGKVDCPLTASAGAMQAATSATEAAAAIIVDGTTTAGALYLNLGIPDAGLTDDGTVTVNGTVTVTYAVLGDY